MATAVVPAQGALPGTMAAVSVRAAKVRPGNLPVVVEIGGGGGRG